MYFPEPASPDALPLSGIHERMLRKGGHFKPRTNLYLSKDNGCPRSPRQREVYDGTQYEPDPNVSTVKTTGTLIRAMLKKRWTEEQINGALSDRQNKGGLYYRFEEYPERLVSKFIAGSPLPGNPPISTELLEALTGNPPISTPGNPPITSPEERAPWVFLPEIAERVLRYAEAEPRSRTDLIERGPVHHKGAATRYVDMLTERGLLVWVAGWRTKPRGPVPKHLARVNRPAWDAWAFLNAA